MLAAAGAMLFAGPAFAQPGRGRGNAGTGLRSPEVAPDGHVTFRHRAAQAAEVIVQLEPGGPSPMVKGDDGVWSVTIGPLAPDIYAYRFTVDGVTMGDPSSGAVMKTQRPNAAGELGQLASWQSQFLVPGNPAPEPWEMTDIPHGAVAHVVFHSRAMDAFRDYFVYTPPAYNAKRSSRYPVLYLLHGAGENASGWSDIGKVNLILDTLISQGKAKEFIIVMPLGHPGQPLPGVTPVAGPARGSQPGGPAANPTASPYMTSLLTEIMPQVEKNYNAGNSKATRALAGLSMGGRQTLDLSLLHPELFSYVGMFSAAVNGVAYPALTPAWAKQFKVLWIACGDDDTVTGAANTAFKAALKDKSIPFTDIRTPGGHSYSVWKRNMVAFAPLLFQ
jgi:enterochelin esterase family protein